MFVRSILLHENPLGLPKVKLNNGLKMSSKLPPPQLPRMSRGLPKKEKIFGVKHIIAVASGKGGVGKSTASVNLAVSLVKLGKKIGLLDADLFGPSIPKMMNLSKNNEPDWDEKKSLMIPLVNYGVKCMSIGFLVKEENAVVWRGLMVMKALEQLIRQVDWSDIDVLIIDLPPGTGDTQLTISQTLPISGAVIVSTPQDVALSDAIKGVAMFKKVDVPILGLIQNMSIFSCPNCGQKTHIFGKDGLKKFSEKIGVDLLCDLPLDRDVCIQSDLGVPISISNPEGVHAKAFLDFGKNVLKKLGI
ncbi:hypothetical protein HDU92_008232 [Lobulomyces angularis]|nr:hypothetical protein HDU92_008232 [Lobulomyces angularis]